jgi:predicted deacylase
MRLATLNTWGMRGDWEARLPLFQDGFRELDADIVTLQETILTDDTDQAADFHVTERTYDFACTCLVTEVHAPDPFGRIWVANHFPDYQPDHEREGCLQAAAAARRLESLALESPGHVIVAGDMDAGASCG